MKTQTFTLICALLGFLPASTLSAVEQWGVFETEFEAQPTAKPWQEIQLSALFQQGTRQIKTPGFWDGANTFRIRFSPPTKGTWTFRTISNQPQLDNQTGSLTVDAPTRENHGPIEVFKTFYLRYTDGTPYHQFGTTCYAWIHQTDALQQQTLETLATSPFNKIRFCVFPKHYTYNRNEPELYAFRKGADGKFDYNQPDPAFWHHLESRILDLQALDIEADIILWHPYDRWGYAEMSDTQDDQYLRYCIARLAPYRNVWWSLANEFDFMTDQPRDRHPGTKQMEDWDRFFSILDQEDPYRRMRGIHNGRIWYDHARDWVTHASIQSSDMNGGVRYRRQYRKPVIYDECKYEGDIPQSWGNITARQMTQRFWLGTLSGCYVGHGETYKHPEDILWWSKGGVLHGASPQRIQWLKDFLSDAPPFDQLRPLGTDKGIFRLGKDDEYYLAYCLEGQTLDFRLPGEHPYKVDVIEPWDMTVRAVGSLTEGSFTMTAVEHDLVYRFVPYAPDEPLRPEARPTASVTEGVPPLTVRFASNTSHPVSWDFDDDADSYEPNPVYTFAEPGIYTVRMTVKDEQGGSALGTVVVRVDHAVDQPLVRAGFSHDNLPTLKPVGSAKRADDGSWIFPPGEPWGRAEANQEALGWLGGLRSFTIMGWLKPEDLTVGSGGNRILFCLKQSQAGIDLVHLADGRMRLSVNEWPDAVKNDSAPGRLVVGEWTFFAVTYDASTQDKQVCWYFNQPTDRPEEGAPLLLDRRNTYHAGSVANQTGPLAIGNFNITMKGYGWDRQFRGTIRSLQLFGSRISSRGALDRQAIEDRRR